MNKFFQELYQKLKHLIAEKNYFMKLARIGDNTDDDIPLNKPLKFLTVTIIIRCFLSG